MPHWHHHCGCPYHRRGHPCPVCDGPEYWPRTRDEWETEPRRVADEPRPAESESLPQQIDGLREAIERLNDRIDALESE